MQAAEHIYVISDLHLGGRSGFQLCPPASRARLVAMLREVSNRHAPGEMELLINGDFVDFLAEESVSRDGEYEAFTNDPGNAATKLERIIRSVDGHASPESVDGAVFQALAALIAKGHQVTIIGGNHDVELAIPGVQAVLRRHLCSSGADRLTFVVNGEAVTRGPALIEHGNRYDGWNAVDHGKLRALLSQLSRSEPLLKLPPSPGSRLVAEVMNELKRRFPFVDMVKPENEALLPLLLFLEPTILQNIRKVAALAVSAGARTPALGAAVRHENFIAGGQRTTTNELPWQSDAPSDEIDRGASSTIAVLNETVAALDETPRVADDGEGLVTRTRAFFLRRQLLRSKLDILLSYELGVESPQYMSQAERLQTLGARVVIFGHTHLARWVPSKDGTSLYVNTGTWCPTIFMDEAAFPNGLDFEQRLTRFLSDLRSGNLTPWIRLNTYSVHIHLGSTSSKIRLLAWSDNGHETEVRAVSI